MHEMFPLTKGHLSNKDRILWQKGGPCQRETTAIHKSCVTHIFLLLILVVVAALWVISDVEGMEACSHRGVCATKHLKREGFTSLQVNLRDENAVDVPHDPPANLFCGFTEQIVQEYTHMAHNNANILHKSVDLYKVNGGQLRIYINKTTQPIIHSKNCQK